MNNSYDLITGNIDGVNLYSGANSTELCPTTEANLGDGISPTTEFLAEQGTIAIGSDSHISVNPIEELRWLEYAQRLIRQQRAILSSNEQVSVGKNLWQQAAKWVL